MRLSTTLLFPIAGYLLFGYTQLVAAQDERRWGRETVREAGRCSMYDACGRKGGIFGQELPCADNGKAREVDSSFRASLREVCGTDSDWTHACCTPSQLETFQQSLAQAEPLLALCPACRLNFRDFYCGMTCSPDQSLFVSVAATQNLSSFAAAFEDSSLAPAPGPAVKSLAFHVSTHFGQGFFDSCKNVKFGATNGYAMEFLGGGAKNWLAFLRYMGTERPGLGSPFQIDFPQPVDDLPIPGSKPVRDATIKPFDRNVNACNSSDPSIRCACPDCPENCLELPHVPSPQEIRASECRVGKLRCFDFALVLLYGITLFCFMFGVGIQNIWERRSVILPKLRSRNSNVSGISMDDPLDQNESHDRQSSNSSHSAALLRSTGPPSGSSIMDSSPAQSLSRNHLGRGASLLERGPLEASQPRSYFVNTYLSKWFYSLGYFCASKPYITLCLGLLICGVLNSGWARFKIEKDPVRLWVAQGSDSARNKEAFESDFGPFYRTEQVFLSVLEEPTQPVLTYERMKWWASIEEEIRQLTSPKGYTLKDVCFAPSGQARSADDCVTQSFMGYFGNDAANIRSNWAKSINECASSPSLCLPPSGQPLSPRLLFGGIPGYSGNHSAALVTVEEDEDALVRATEARALVITYVVDNSLDKAVIAKAEDWENTLRTYLAQLAIRARTEAGLQIAYSTGVSLEQELNKSTNTDVPIVILSYVVMFVYVSLALGGTMGSLFGVLGSLLRQVHRVVYRKIKGGAIYLENEEDGEQRPGHLFRRVLVESKFLLGLWGIAIVLLSVSTSVGLFSMLGIKITLIIAEVIPFLVLAIGVDNVFILAHELERQNARAYATMPRHGGGQALVDDDQRRAEYDEDLDGLPPPEERVARALSRMGPSITLSAVCETVAFSLGALVGMPAVRNFAIYAAGAVAINAILQVTVFVSAITIDLRRTEANRVDCLPCIKMPPAKSSTYAVASSSVAKFISNHYAPFLLRKYTKQAVLAIFSLLFILSWVAARTVDLGLDQRLALPSESYLIPYFNALDDFLDVGPPVYFVTEDVNVTARAGQQALCGRFSTCEDQSIANILEAERKQSDSSFLAEPPAVWLDDFFQWLNPALDTCCRVRRNDHNIFCGPSESESRCMPCYEAESQQWNVSMEGLPQGDKFMRYLEQWLQSPTDEACPLGGQAPYSSALSLKSAHSVTASHFRTYHTPLKSQADFIDAMAAANRVADDLSQTSGGHVYPYSVFYVFFDQYATITATTRQVLFLALLAVFGMTSFMLGSFRTGAVVAWTTFMSVMMVMGIMGLWNISLNAVSLVNLVISIGISVEFCSHIARAFMGALGGGLPYHHPSGPKERDERAWVALADVGSSVFSGITMTKLIGISVLALTRSQLLRTYYFRMWLALILAGALHGLVFLPVALSYAGGRGWADSEDADFLEEQINYSERLFLDNDSDSDPEMA